MTTHPVIMNLIKNLGLVGMDSWSSPDGGRSMNTFGIVKNGASCNAVVTVVAVVTKDSSMSSLGRTRKNTFMGDGIVPPAGL